MTSTRPPSKDQVALLRAQRQAHLPWHGARLNFLARCLLALLSAGSVNLTKIARAFGGDAQLPSHYKRLQRFLRGFDSLGAGQNALARLLAALSGVPRPWVLSLDRSDWLPCAPKVRLPWINFLVVGIVHEGVAYPVLWSLRPGAGASAAPERIALLERFLALFGRESVRFVAMDREFGTSKAWIGWLQAKRLDYRVRLCLRTRLGRGRGRATVSVGALCAALLPERPRRFQGRLRLFGQRVWLAAVRLPAEAAARAQTAKHARGHAGQPGDEWVIIAAPAGERTGKVRAQELLEDYRLRWGIEMLFGALKSRGFALESTALQHGERLERLLGLLALAFAWAHRTGLWLAAQGQAPRWLTSRQRRAKSLFRCGLDYLCQLLTPTAMHSPLRRSHFHELIGFFVLC